MGTGPQWYYIRDGARQGPASADDLRAQFAAGQLAPETPVWRQGLADWQQAIARPEFFQQDPQPDPAADPASQAAAYGQYPAQDPAQAWQGGYAQQGGYPAGSQPGYPQGGYGPGGYGQGGVLPYQTPERYYSRRVEYAGFWLRFAAVLLDGLILTPVNLLIQFAVQESLGGSRRAGMAGVLIINVLQLITAWLYESLQTCSTYQATLGKRACGIIVTDAAGGRLTFGRATARYFAKMLSSLTCLVGYLMATWTERSRALHDMIADTVVVKKQ